MKKIVKHIPLIICILWMGFIFYNSSLNGEESNGTSYKVVNKITNNNYTYLGSSKNNNTKSVQNFNVFIRKNAHAFEFGVLSILLALTFFTYNRKGRSVVSTILLIVLIYAVSDEYHQLYVPGRGSNVKDVMIDFLGGIIGLLLFYISYYMVYDKLRKRS